MDNTTELENILRSLLISSPRVINANRLLIDFEDTEGRRFPFRELGFSSFIDYLKSISSVVKLVPINSHNPDVYPVVTEESRHINKLVTKQKLTSSRRKSSFPKRSHRYNSRFGRQDWTMPVNQRTIGYNQQLPLSRPTHDKVSINVDPDFMRKILWELVKKVASSKSGVWVGELENHFMNSYRREDLTRNGIFSGNDILVRANDMVNVVDGKVYPKLSAPPEVVSHSNNPDKTNGNKSQTDDYEDNDDLAYWDFETKREEEITDEKVYNLENDECNFSKVMISNFRKILAKYPDGVWATELHDKYYEEFNVPLDIIDLGYNSAIEMASLLPDVFTYKRASSHDWKLYDARLVKEVDYNKHEEYFEGSYDENEGRYIPKSILENIKKLVSLHSAGFKSTELLSFYEDYFKKTLDLKTLGFEKVDDFLECLKKDITIRKVTDYSILLPKHEVVTLEADPIIPVEPLRIKNDQLSFSGPPPNILRPTDTIATQRLPDLKTDGQDNEPLMQMEVRVGEVFSPGLFYLLLDAKYNELEILMEDLDKFYNLSESHYHIILPYLTVNLICACKYDGLWHRAKVTGLKKDGSIEIEYIDYGTQATVDRSELRFLQNDFAMLPAQSIQAKLLGIKPSNDEKKWPADATKEFLKLVHDKRLIADVYHIGFNNDKERIQLEVILYNTKSPQHIICNDHLVKKGLAEFVIKCEDTSQETLHLKKQDITSATVHSSTQSIENISQETLHLKNQDITPATVHSSNQSGQADQRKPLRRPPPGFEGVFLETSGVPHTTPCLQQSSFSAHANPGAYFFGNPALHLPQMQINNYFIGQNSENLNLCNPHIQQHCISTPHVVQSNRTYNCWPPPGMHGLPPSQSIYNRPNYPLPNFIPYTNQQVYSNPRQIGFNLNNINIPLNVQNCNATELKILRGIPDWSSDLTTPESVPQETMNTQSVVRKNIGFQLQQRITTQFSLTGEQDIEKENDSPTECTAPVRPDLSVTSYKYEHTNDTYISRPITPSTPSLENVETLHTYNKNDDENLVGCSIYESENQLANKLCNDKRLYESTLDNFSEISISNHSNHSTSDEYASATDNTAISRSNTPSSTMEKFENIHMHKINYDNSVGCSLHKSENELTTKLRNSKQLYKLRREISAKEIQISNSSNNSTSDEYASETEYVDKTVQSTIISSCVKDSTPSSFLHCENKQSEEIPDSWEDIETDDTPAKAEQFLVDFKKPLSFIRDVQFEIPVNWKDKFDPDGINNSKRSNERQITKTISTSLAKLHTKKTLVQQLEMDNKFFHLICVDNKLAVLSHEFYPQFTTINMQIVCKIVEAKYRPFTLILRRDKPDLFAELDKVEEFGGGVSKNDVLKLGKASISYLSDIPQVYTTLKLQNKTLLDQLKEITQEFLSC